MEKYPFCIKISLSSVKTLLVFNYDNTISNELLRQLNNKIRTKYIIVATCKVTPAWSVDIILLLKFSSGQHDSQY